MTYLDYFWIAVGCIAIVVSAIIFLPPLIKGRKRKRRGDKYDLSWMSVSTEEHNEQTDEHSVEPPKTITKTAVKSAPQSTTEKTEPKVDEQATSGSAVKASMGILSFAGKALDNNKAPKKEVEDKPIQLDIEYIYRGKKAKVTDYFPTSAYEDSSRTAIKKYLEKKLGTYQFNITNISRHW